MYIFDHHRSGILALLTYVLPESIIHKKGIVNSTKPIYKSVEILTFQSFSITNKGVRYNRTKCRKLLEQFMNCEWSSKQCYKNDWKTYHDLCLNPEAWNSKAVRSSCCNIF